MEMLSLSPFLPNFMKPYDLIKNVRADPRQKNPFVTLIEEKSGSEKMRLTTKKVNLNLFRHGHYLIHIFKYDVSCNNIIKC